MPKVRLADGTYMYASSVKEMRLAAAARASPSEKVAAVTRWQAAGATILALPFVRSVSRSLKKLGFLTLEQDKALTRVVVGSNVPVTMLQNTVEREETGFKRRAGAIEDSGPQKKRRLTLLAKTEFSQGFEHSADKGGICKYRYLKPVQEYTPPQAGMSIMLCCPIVWGGKECTKWYEAQVLRVLRDGRAVLKWLDNSKNDRRSLTVAKYSTQPSAGLDCWFTFTQ